MHNNRGICHKISPEINIKIENNASLSFIASQIKTMYPQAPIASVVLKAITNQCGISMISVMNSGSCGLSLAATKKDAHAPIKSAKGKVLKNFLIITPLFTPHKMVRHKRSHGETANPIRQILPKARGIVGELCDAPEDLRKEALLHAKETGPKAFGREVTRPQKRQWLFREKFCPRSRDET